MIRIRKILNRAIALNGNKVVLSCLNTLLEEESPLANEPTLIDARQNVLDKKIREGTVSNEDATLEQSQISAALQGLVDNLEESDFRQEESKTLDDLIDVVQLIDEEQRREEAERRAEEEERRVEEEKRRAEEEEERREEKAKLRSLNYMAMLGLGFLTFGMGVFSSNKILGPSDNGGAISCVEIEAEVERLKTSEKENGIYLLDVNKQLKRCRDSVLALVQENNNLPEVTSNTTDLSTYRRRITRLERDLDSEITKLATCNRDLAAARAAPPTTSSTSNPLASLRTVWLHCKQSSWDSNLGKKIKDLLGAKGYEIKRAPPGASEYAIEYKSGSNTSREIARALLGLLQDDYCIRKVNTFSNTKEIHVYIPR